MCTSYIGLGVFSKENSDNKHPEQPMKIYLDDERPVPDGWTLARWPEEAIVLLITGQVTDISLDHDLGDDTHGTGYDVILWIEEAVATTQFTPPNITVHSANSSARQKMELGIASIQRYAERKTKPA